MWRNLDKSRPESVHYSVLGIAAGEDEMAALRAMFPDGKANEMNFVLFSTSGVHGTYCTIEDVEATLNGTASEEDAYHDVTFVIVHPRLVGLRYGNCIPRNQEDIDLLKKLRASSWETVQGIGAVSQAAEGNMNPANPAIGGAHG